MKVALVSSDIRWENVSANLNLSEEVIKELATNNDKPDLIVFPELFTTGFSVKHDLSETKDGASLSWMRTSAEKFGVALLASVAVNDNGKIFNRAYFVYPDGSYLFYDKRHLFSYGGENRIFSRGNSRFIAPYCGFNISVNICYDLRFPVWSRNEQCDYDLLINIANWPSSRSYVLESLSRARAIENQSFFAFVNRVGDDPDSHYNGEKLFFDYKGNVSEPFYKGEYYSVYKISKEPLKDFRNKFRFWQDADDFKII